MSRLGRTAPVLPMAHLLAFVALFLALYAGAAAVAERQVARTGEASAFQRLLAARGQSFDWVVLGASHALPLAYGGLPGRLERESGQRMIVLAEVGAGPLYTGFLFRQATQDIRSAHLLYIVDSFGFAAPAWNEARIADRKLLRLTPLRPPTMAAMAKMVLSEGVPVSALADYATAFSKLNPPEWFPQDDWKGRENFDRIFRPSSRATEARIDYLFPAPPSAATRTRYLDTLVTVFTEAQARGISVVAVKLPLPEAFRRALPDEAVFDADLRARLAPLGIPLHDLSAAMDDPGLYFDPDHLNRKGVDRLYREYLRPILLTAD